MIETALIANLEQALIYSGAVKTPQEFHNEVLASGLDSSRKLNFGLDEALDVAEAGRGGSGASISSPSQPSAVLSYVASDKALYAGELTSYPFQVEAAKVYRTNDGNRPEVYAEGFTNIIDIAFDKSSGLYVLEYDADGILNGSDAGALIYLSPDRKTCTAISDDRLINPTGLEIGSEGDVYISNKGFSAGQGEVRWLKPNTFSPDPIYDQVKRYTTTIAADGDLADVYYPVLPKATPDRLPIALMLPEAFVDKADYSNYAKEVASYGFVVVVPNNERTLTAPDGQLLTGLLVEEQQVNEVLAQIKLEDADTASPIFKIVDTTSIGLLGHGFGGFVGLAAIQNIIRSASTKDYTRPLELKAGIFYGASFQSAADSGIFQPIDNQDIPTGLIAGTLDSINNFGEVASTYDNIQDTPKALIAIKGANHYSIANADNVTLEPNRPTLDRATATSAIGRWSGLFLRANLLGDRGAFNYVCRIGSDLDPNVSVINQKGCRLQR